MIKRKYVPIYKVAKVAGYDEFWQVDFDDMGWCKDKKTGGITLMQMMERLVTL